MNSDRTANTLSTNSNYNAIDIFKIISAVAIIVIHTTPLMSYSEELNFFITNIFTRFAVPFFFITSGFFFFKGLLFENGKIKKCKENNAKLFKYLKRASLLYLIWSALYLFFVIPQWIESGWFSASSFIDYGLSFFTIGTYYHIWYMLVTIYSVPIIYIILRYINIKYLLGISVVFYTISILTYSYSSALNVLFGINIENLPGANYIFYHGLPRGIAFISVGAIAIHRKTKLSNKTNLVLLILSFILLALEVFINYFYLSNETVSYLVFTFPLSYFLFNAISSIEIKVNKENCATFRKMSTIIYFLHPMIIVAFNTETMNSVLRFFIVTISTFIISFVIVKLSSVKKLNFLSYLY